MVCAVFHHSTAETLTERPKIMRHTPWKEATWSLFLLFDQTSHGGATILSRWRACWPRCSPSCCALMAKEAAMQSSIEILTMCESEPHTTPAHLTHARPQYFANLS